MILPKVIGHRGAAGMAPENTLAGFRHAISVGAPWVEFDTQLSADKRVIVFHDDRLDRTTDGSGSVYDTDFETIRKLDAGAWFDPAFAGELVPTLKETLALLLQSGLHPDIEIKPAEGRETETARAVMAEVLAVWPVGAPPPLITSIKHDCLRIARELAPDWPRGLVCFRYPRNWRALLEDLACGIIIRDYPLDVRSRIAYKASLSPGGAHERRQANQQNHSRRRSINRGNSGRSVQQVLCHLQPVRDEDNLRRRITYRWGAKNKAAVCGVPYSQRYKGALSTTRTHRRGNEDGAGRRQRPLLGCLKGRGSRPWDVSLQWLAGLDLHQSKLPVEHYQTELALEHAQWSAS